MSKEQKQFLILGGLALAVVIVLVYQFALAPGPGPYELPEAVQQGAAPPVARPAGAPGAAPPQLQTDEVDLDELLVRVTKVSFDYDAVRSARNPMTALIGRRQRTGDEDRTVFGTGLVQRARSMLLTGIVWDRRNPIAILDNEVVNQGYVFAGDDLAAGIVVESIEPSRVILRVEDQLIPVNLEER